MLLNALGIVEDTLFIGPQGSEAVHTIVVNKGEKAELIEMGVEDFPDSDYIYCQLECMTPEEFKEYVRKANEG